ncbi:MAG: hypothetical protein AB1756_00470 [Acidobacteriota bacterium]
MDLLESGSNRRKGQVFLFMNNGNHHNVEIFHEVCNSLDLELVSIKGRIGEKSVFSAITHRPIAAIVIQRKNPGENLNIISEIKVNLKKLPIIFYVTKYSENLENLIRRVGVHYFLLKDFEKEELCLVLDMLSESEKSDIN